LAKTSSSPPEIQPPASSEDRSEAFAFWSTIAIGILGALLLVATGRAPAPAKAKDASTEAVKLPEPIEPAAYVDTAPLRFVWTPGGDDVDLSQVIIFRGDMTRIWESAPTDTNEVTVPLHAFDVIYPMEPCFWRVREVTDGKPRAASALKPFKIKNPPQHSLPAKTSAG